MALNWNEIIMTQSEASFFFTVIAIYPTMITCVLYMYTNLNWNRSSPTHPLNRRTEISEKRKKCWKSRRAKQTENKCKTPASGKTKGKKSISWNKAPRRAKRTDQPLSYYLSLSLSWYIVDASRAREQENQSKREREPGNHVILGNF